MAQRSWLFVPGDSEKKLGKANATGADAIIVDLEDSVSPGNKARARELSCEWLAAHRRQVTQDRRMARWVRINALDTPMWRDDLLAVLPGAPDGVMLPKSAGPESVQQLAAELYELEQKSGIPAGTTRILPLVSETASAALTIPAVPTTPANGNDQFVNWDGAAPGAGSVTNPGAVSVWAWTNSSGGGSLNYAATAFAANGPVLGDIAVASGAGLAHPGTALAASGTAVTFARNAVQTGSWTYSLGGTPASWAAGAYTSTVTYTATSI